MIGEESCWTRSDVLKPHTKHQDVYVVTGGGLVSREQVVSGTRETAGDYILFPRLILRAGSFQGGNYQDVRKKSLTVRKIADLEKTDEKARTASNRLMSSGTCLRR